MWPTRPCSGSLVASCHVHARPLVAAPHACACPLAVASPPCTRRLWFADALAPWGRHLMHVPGRHGLQHLEVFGGGFFGPACWLDAGSFLGPGCCSSSSFSSSFQGDSDKFLAYDDDGRTATTA